MTCNVNSAGPIAVFLRLNLKYHQLINLLEKEMNNTVQTLPKGMFVAINKDSQRL